MKIVTVFNTIVGAIGCGSMINHFLEAGVNMDPGVLFGIWIWTSIVSVVGTIGIVSFKSAMQNRREKEYAEMLRKAYSYKR